MSKKSLDIAKLAIRNSLTDGKIDPDKVKRQIATILKSEPSRTLKNLKTYKKLLVAKLIKEKVTVISAFELDFDLKKELDDFINANFENYLPTEYLVDKTVGGGIKIQIGDKIIDSTLTSKLELLESDDD